MREGDFVQILSSRRNTIDDHGIAEEKSPSQIEKPALRGIFFPIASHACSLSQPYCSFNYQGDSMAILRISLLAVLKRFPAFEKTMKRLYREDDTFQSICEDYAECSEALQRWSQSALEEAPTRRKEYADLLQDLEVEILQYLGEHGKRVK